MARKGPTQLPEFVAHQATTPPPEPDLLQHLSFEHRQIERLWSELQLGHRRHIETDYRPGTRLGGHGQHELFRNIMNLLAEHEALELQMLYPAVRRVVGDEMADHATADHEEIRRLLDDVDGEDPTDELVFQAFSTIMTKVLAHIDEEERISLPMLRAVLTSQEIKDLGEPPRSAGAPAAPEADVIDLAAAEREQSEPDQGSKAGLGERSRRLLRRG